MVEFIEYLKSLHRDLPILYKWGCSYCGRQSQISMLGITYNIRCLIPVQH